MEFGSFFEVSVLFVAYSIRVDSVRVSGFFWANDPSNSIASIRVPSDVSWLLVFTRV